MSTTKKKDTKWIWMTGAVTVLCVLLVAVLVVAGGTGRRLREQLRLGDKYLTELDYEQAIAAYRAAIEIDPKCEEAYLGLAEAYVAKGEPEQAAAVLEAGCGETGSRTLQDKLEEVNALAQQAQAGGSGAGGQGADGEALGEDGNLPAGDGGQPPREGEEETPEGEDGDERSGDNPAPDQPEEFTQWADSLYERLIGGEYESLISEIETDPQIFIEKCRPYVIEEKDDVAKYWFVTSGGQILGVTNAYMAKEETGEVMQRIGLFYCSHDEDLCHEDADETWRYESFGWLQGDGDCEVHYYSSNAEDRSSGWFVDEVSYNRDGSEEARFDVENGDFFPSGTGYGYTWREDDWRWERIF